MRIFISSILLLLMLLNGGCAILQQELNNRGGYVDYLADKYWWKADSKKMRALRAYALHTAIARIAMISPKGAVERNQLAYQIGNAGMYAQRSSVGFISKTLILRGRNDGSQQQTLRDGQQRHQHSQTLARERGERPYDDGRGAAGGI